MAKSEKEVLVDFFIRNYENQDLTIFEQHFISGHDSQAVSEEDGMDTICTAFPMIRVPKQDEGFGYITPGGNMMGATRIAFGPWYDLPETLSENEATFMDGREGGFATVFTQSFATVWTALSEPMSQYIQILTDQISNEQAMAFGTMGGVRSIPAGHVTRTALVGGEGIKKGIENWGDFFQKFHGKSTAKRDSFLEMRYLGYYTDAGAYYYYNTEPGMNYEKTFDYIRDYADDTNYPIRFAQYDSWFYPHGEGNGLLEWDFRTDNGYFPSGGEAAYANHKLPIVAHNRWFGPDTVYATENGGNYDWILEDNRVDLPIGPPGSGVGPYSFPNDTRFWPDFFSNRRQWGLKTYEQDWMDVQINRMNATQQDLVIGRDNWRQMDWAAEQKSLDIQYCLTLPRFVLFSAELDSVSHARGSPDYAYNFLQWNIGFQSLWGEAAGLAVLKDTFHSVHVQPEVEADGDVPGDIFNEHFSDLHAAVSTFSSGPVVPGDRIGFEDRLLIDKSINTDGLILRMGNSMKPINSEMSRKARNDWEGPASQEPGENLHVFGNRFGAQIWAAKSEFGKFVGSALLFASLIEDYETNAADLEIEADSYIFEGYPEQHLEVRLSAEAIKLSVANRWGLVYSAPIKRFQNGNQLVLFGETDKWSYLSPQRVKQINDYGSFLTIELFGAIGEEIEFTTGKIDQDENIFLNTRIVKFDRSQKAVLYFYDFE